MKLATFSSIASLSLPGAIAADGLFGKGSEIRGVLLIGAACAGVLAIVVHLAIRRASGKETDPAAASDCVASEEDGYDVPPVTATVSERHNTKALNVRTGVMVALALASLGGGIGLALLVEENQRHHSPYESHDDTGYVVTDRPNSTDLNVIVKGGGEVDYSWEFAHGTVQHSVNNTRGLSICNQGELWVGWLNDIYSTIPTPQLCFGCGGCAPSHICARPSDGYTYAPHAIASALRETYGGRWGCHVAGVRGDGHNGCVNNAEGFAWCGTNDDVCYKYCDYKISCVKESCW